MTTVTGSGVVQSIYGDLSGTFTVTSFSPTGFTTSSGLTVAGTGLTYSQTPQSNGITTVGITGGTITGVTLNSTSVTNPGQQTYSNLSVDGAAASQAVASAISGDPTAFNNLFFGGDDTFTWSGPLEGTLYGAGGNDTFNISSWGTGDISGEPLLGIDGGAGNDTLNISGGITGTVKPDYYQNDTNFNVVNIETVNLAAGSNYTIIAPSNLVTAGNTLTINGSALGPSDSFVFNDHITGGGVFSGNLVLKGGAGTNIFQGGSGNNTFIAGSGFTTVSFDYGLYGSQAGVTVNLGNSGAQSVGGEYGGTDTFFGIENVIGTYYNDTLTGDTNSNVLDGNGGNDTINGGAGFDTAVFHNPYSSYTITYSGGNTIVSGPDGTATLNSVELGRFSDKTVHISGPVVTTADKRVAAGQSVALSSLFSVNDLNSQTITEYQLWDGTVDPNSGYFTINGVAQPSHTILTITAAQLAQTQFVGGVDSNSLQIRAYDGTSWSADDNGSWAPFTAGPSVDHAPVVATPNVSEARNQTLPLSSLFTVTDADGDTMTMYQLWDSSSAPGSGYFIINGVAQPAHTVITISAAQLAQTNFFTGEASTSLQIRAFDGYEWSAADNAAWAPFTVSVPADNPPVVTTSNLTEAAGQTLSFSSLVPVTDADGDAITEYQLWDSTRDPNAGHWVVNGVAQAAGTVITITGAQTAQTTFVTGSVPTSLQVRASDGILWSAGDTASWAPFTVSPPVDHPPVVTTGNQTLTAGTTVALSSLFTASDPDGDTITKYELWESTRDPNAGYYTINGVRQAAGTIIDITAAQLAQTSFVAGTVPTALQIRANDGTLWSAADNAAWAPFTVSLPPPVVTTTNLGVAEDNILPLSTMFTVTDANGLAITKYELWDSTSGSGYFTINGIAQPAHTVIDITAAQLAQTAFVTGAGNTNLQIRAYDGVNWSAADNASWAPFTVSPANVPFVGGGDLTLPHGGYSMALPQLVNVSSQGVAITEYELLDTNTDANAGHWSVNGVAQPNGTPFIIPASQFGLTDYVTGLEADHLQIRAGDGTTWSAPANAEWAPFTISVSNTPPVVTTSDVTKSANTSVPLSNLFTVTDADNDTMTKYELWESTRDPNAGHFVVNGTAEPAGTIIDITAAQLAQTSFLTGTISAALQIRAFDGTAWSATDNAAWAPFHVNVS